MLLNVELLEDNEVLTIENVRRLGRIVDPKKKASFTPLENSLNVSKILPRDLSFIIIFLGNSMLYGC